MDDADVIDLTEDCNSTTSEHPEMPHNNTGDDLQFPMHLFLKTEGECVDELPHDIDGFKLYKIKCSQQEWVEKSKDLWHFKMNTSRRKDLIGTRKVGRCQGSLYCMSAQCPFKCSAEGTPNMTNFQNVSGHKVCFSCGSIATRKWFGAQKLTEYCRESHTLTVYHVGVHKCHLKKYTQIYKKQVREAMLQNRGLGARGIQQAKVGQAVVEGNIQEAQRRAMWLSYANVRSEKAKIAQEKNPDKHSLEAVGILIQATDKEDKYLIYRINNSQFNASPIMFLKVVHQWHSWQLTWIRMDQSIHYRLKTHISMAATQGAQAIKLWHCLYITRPCTVYLSLQ